MTTPFPNDPNDEKRDWLTPKELADRWRCSRDTIYRMKDVPYFMRRGERLYDPEVVAEYEEEHTVNGG